MSLSSSEQLPAGATERFWANVDTSGDCWTWRASKTRDGYGRFWGGADLGQQPAHRVAYVVAGNRIPDGFHIDHLCRNPGCVRPSHLEAVTPAENTRRGERATRTHCANGHEYTPANTYVWTPAGTSRRERCCRACNRTNAANTKDRREQRRAAVSQISRAIPTHERVALATAGVTR